jgi:hypothetical protein
MKSAADTEIPFSVLPEIKQTKPPRHSLISNPDNRKSPSEHPGLPAIGPDPGDPQ